MKHFLYLCIFLSGLSALIYQVSWQSLLSQQIGSHALASSILLAGFFLCLSIGYQFIGKHSRKIMNNQLRLYSLVELGIGLYALLSLSLFSFLNEIWPATGEKNQDLIISFLISVLFLAVPVILMGATLAIIVEVLITDKKTARKEHTYAYSLNTFGAFFGAIFAGYYALESWGIPISILHASYINLLIALSCYWLSKKEDPSFYALKDEETKTSKTSLNLISISFLSGFYVFGLETLFIRISGVLFGSSIYTYSCIVASFIFAIGLGSIASEFLYRKFRDNALAMSYFGAFLSCLLLYLLIPSLPEFIWKTSHIFSRHWLAFYPNQIFNFLILFFLLILPVGFLGMNLPLLFQSLTRSNKIYSENIGSLYSFNAIGSVLGALIGGFVFFQFFRDDEAYRIYLGMILISAFLSLLFLQSRKVKQIPLLISIVLVFFLPPWNEKTFVPAPFTINKVFSNSFNDYFQKKKEEYKLLYSKFDSNTIVHVTDFKETRSLYVNGKADIAQPGDHKVRSYNALLPLLLSKDPKKVFHVGLGAGLSTAITSSHPKTKKVKVVEISKGVLEALPYFKEFNQGMQPQKIKYIVDDAYRVLKQSTEKYNLILCEPSNPWVNGVDKLYSIEYLNMLSKRLKPNGFYASWFPLFQMDPLSAKMVLKAFQKSFSWVQAYSSGNLPILIIGANQELQISKSQLQENFEFLKDRFKELEIENYQQALASQVLSHSQITNMLEDFDQVHSLNYPKLPYQLVKAKFRALNTSIHKLWSEEPISRLSSFQFWNLDISNMSLSDIEKVQKIFKSKNTYKYLENRWAFEIKKRNKESDLIPDSAFANLEFWNQPETKEIKQNLDAENKDESLSDTFQKLLQLQQAYEMGIKVYPEKISQLLPLKCQSIECFMAKKSWLYITRSGPMEVWKINKDEMKLKKNQQKIENLFRQKLAEMKSKSM